MVLFAVAKTAAGALLATDLFYRTKRAVPRISAGRKADETLDVVRMLGGEDGFLPTPWLSGLLGGHFQTMWYGLKLDDPPLGRIEEDTWLTADGGTIGLAWPECKLPASAPIVIILPGLCGSVEGSGHNITASIAAGLRPVVFHARGCPHPLTSPRFNLFGDTDDLREAIDRITQSFPGAPLTMSGSSAGTGLMVRYLGEEGSRTPVVAGVINSPGYDIGTGLARCLWLYDGAYYINILRKHWLTPTNLKILEARDPEAVRKLHGALKMHS